MGEEGLCGQYHSSLKIAEWVKILATMNGILPGPKKIIGISNILEKEEKNEITPIGVINSAHKEKINALIQMSANHFVSGSDDGQIKIWNTNTELKKVVDFEPYQKITALSYMIDCWVSATDQGVIVTWNTEGKRIKLFKSDSRPIKGLCLNPDDCQSFYAGAENCVQLWDTNGHLLHSGEADERVHCLSPMKCNALFVGSGSKLEYWKRKDKKYKKDVAAVLEGFAITCTTYSEPCPKVAACWTNGNVSIIDALMLKAILTRTEHTGPVLSIESLSPQEFITGGFDQKIKVWDCRQWKSAFTMDLQRGSVSALLAPKNYRVLAAAGPKLGQLNDRAHISGWDLRFLKQQMD